MKHVIHTVATLALLAMPALADEQDEKLKIANDYAIKAAQDMDIDAIVRQMWVPIILQIETSGKTVTDEQKAEIQKLYKDTFSEPMLKMMMDQGPAMAEIYTLEELQALNAFYDTDAGRSAIRKMPQLMQKQQPQIMAIVNDSVTTVLPKLQGILK